MLWSGHEYSLVEVADAYATGSSIMPQKKNPVVAELTRGRAGRTAGTLVQLLTMAKGVTLGYSCDLQDDKPYLWNAIDTYLTTLKTPRKGTHCPAVWPTAPSAQRQSPSGGLVNPLPDLLGTGTYR